MSVLSVASEEEHSLLSTSRVASYSRSNDDPFTLRLNQENNQTQIRLGEHSAAYAVLKQHNLLITAFRKEFFTDIFVDDDLNPNSSLTRNFAKRWRWGVYWTPGCGLLVYRIFNKEIVVPPGHICCFTDEDNNYIFARPGIYNIQDPFLKQISRPIAIHGSDNQRNVIEHGNRTVVTVPQGMIGVATDMGQYLLLPPGLHSWKSETIRFDKMCRLNDSPIIQLGPFTIVTVDDGYMAITINNGRQILLPGGQTHLLTHQKWKFERFMCMKIQSDELSQITASTADNLMVSIDATVTWKVSVAQKAAVLMTDSVLRSDISVGTGTEDDLGNVGKLRRYVIMQATSGIAKFIGSINYSDYFLYIRSILKSRENVDEASNLEDERESHIVNPFFDEEGLNESVEVANKITHEFGVEVIGINILSATPIHKGLTTMLASGAISSAEALQTEAKARGESKRLKIEAEAAAIATKIQAESEAQAVLIKARADAEAEILKADGAKAAEILRAEGSKEVASLLETSKFAVALETIKTSAGAIKDTDKFYFGQEPQYLSHLVMKNA